MKAAPPLLPQTVGAFLGFQIQPAGSVIPTLISDASRHSADDPTSSL